MSNLITSNQEPTVPPSSVPSSSEAMDSSLVASSTLEPTAPSSVASSTLEPTLASSVASSTPVPSFLQHVVSSRSNHRISPTRFAVVLTAIYFVIALSGAMHHEMWNDEFQAWLIARDSANLLELVSNIRYEGSGPLWYLLLYPLAQISHNPVSMQVLHVSIASACVYLIARYAPFAWYQKLLLPVGYFFIFEYCLISRSYVLGNLLIFLFCAAYQYRKNFFVLYGLLAMLSLTNAFSAIFSVALGVGLLVDRFVVRRGERLTASCCEPPTSDSQQSGSSRRSGKFAGKRLRLVGGAVSFVVAVGACMLFMIPPRDGFLNDWQSRLGQRITFQEPTSARDLARAMGIPLYAYVPIPATHYNFWETSIFRTDFFTIPSHWLGLSVALVLSFLVCLRSYPFAATSYLVGTLAIVAFSYLVLTGATRHFGQVYILLIACLWIAGFCRSTKGAERSFSKSNSFSVNSERSSDNSATINAGYTFNKVTKFGGIMFVSILALQACLGLYCYSLDLRYPFSNSKAIADYLKTTGWADKPIFVHSINGVGICSLLDRAVYQYNDERVGTFWQSRQAKEQDPWVLVREIEKYCPNSPCVLVTSKIPFRSLWRVLELHSSKKFKNAIVPTENRYLWIVSPRKKRLKTH